MNPPAPKSPADQAPAEDPTRASETDPADELLGLVRGLVSELGGREDAVRLGADFERDLGLGSLEKTELITRTERAFGARLPDTALSEARTAGALLKELERALVSGGNESLAARIRRAEAARPAGDAKGDADADPAGDGWRIPEGMRTIVEILRFRAEREPGRGHLHVLDDDLDTTPISYGELWQRSLEVAGGLATLGVTKGDRVGLVLPTGTDFFYGFLGTLICGAAAVPIYPPIRMDELDAYLDRHARILQNAGVKALLTDSLLKPVTDLLRDRVDSIEATPRVTDLLGSPCFGAVDVRGDDLALIQYTSGSTGDPKGVALRHRNLVANCLAIGRDLSFDPTHVGISWLPLYHDMGLIGAWLSVLVHSMPFYVMSPLQFLIRPERLLWAFHRYRGTVCASPNFGYELCTRKIDVKDLEGLDLSSWRAALNGSEPVRKETIDRFQAKFGPFGFGAGTMLPVYGLAESAVAVTFAPEGRGPRYDAVDREDFLTNRRATPAAEGDSATLTFVSAGFPLFEHEVRIIEAADRFGEPIGERCEGRIQFRGPSTMRGYFKRPDATKETFVGDWIDTGDLGYLADRELFVTGRLKDLVIKAGRKYHPQDIELAAWTVAGVRKGCVVAFAAPAEQGEAIVVVCESRAEASRHPGIETEIREAVQRAIGTPADRVLVVPIGTIPKTSSGKLRRRETRERYLRGGLIRSKSSMVWVALAVVAKSLWPRLKRGVARVGRAIFGAYAAVTFVAFVALIRLLIHLPRTEDAAHRMGRKILRIAGLVIGLLPKRRGGRLPSEGPVIAVSNHATYPDAMILLATLDRNPTFTAKAAAHAMPIIGPVMKRLGHLKVHRTTNATFLDSYELAKGALEKGRCVHVFPEGTFTSQTGVRPFRLGAFKLAVELGLPVHAVAIRGARAVIRSDRRLPRPGRIEVIALDPIWPDPAGGFRAATDLRDRTRRALAEAVGEPLVDVASAALPPGASR